MKITISFIITLFFMTQPTLAKASTFLKGLPNLKPEKILNDQKDRFFVDYGSWIYVVSDKIDYTVVLKDKDKNYQSSSFFLKTVFQKTVSSTGTIHSVFKSSYTPKESKTTYYRLILAECIQINCTNTILYNWSNTEGSKNVVSYTSDALRISKTDSLFFTVNHSYPSEKKQITKIYYYYNKQKVSKKKYFEAYSKNFPKPKSGIEVRNTKKEGRINSNTSFSQIIKKTTSGFTNMLLNLKIGEDASWFRLVKDIDATDFKVDNIVKKHKTKRTPRYKRTVLWDRNEAPHIFFHDPVNRSFYHRFYSRENSAIIEQLVDHGESGSESIAFSTEKEIWTIHYYNRTAFNKGMLVTVHRLNDGHILDQFQLDASKSRNSGWDMVGGESSSHRILVTYLSDKKNKRREFVLLKNIEELKSLSETFNKFGNPRGKGFPSNPPVNSFKELPPKGYINIGTGMQYVLWSMWTKEPGEESNVSMPYKAEYRFSDSILNMFSLEGKYGSTNFGLKYATKMLDKKVEQDGSGNAKKLNKLAAKIGWDRLIFNYDLKIDYESMESEVFFTDKSGQVPDRNFTTDFKEIKLSLLTAKRHHFGLLFQTYDFYQPGYIYKSAAGSTSYYFAGQAIGEIDVTNYFLHYGYSSMDYITKYETKISDWFLDGEIRLGLSSAKFNGDLTVSGNFKLDKSTTIGYGTQLELGWIWFKRWEALKQIGGAVKLSYRLDFSGIGSSSKPENKETASSKGEEAFRFQRTELRHGPLLFVSLHF